MKANLRLYGSAFPRALWEQPMTSVHGSIDLEDTEEGGARPNISTDISQTALNDERQGSHRRRAIARPAYPALDLHSFSCTENCMYGTGQSNKYGDAHSDWTQQDLREQGYPR